MSIKEPAKAHRPRKPRRARFQAASAWQAQGSYSGSQAGCLLGDFRHLRGHSSTHDSYFSSAPLAPTLAHTRAHVLVEGPSSSSQFSPSAATALTVTQTSRYQEARVQLYHRACAGFFVPRTRDSTTLSHKCTYNF
eukprot:3811242-Rhodomonas_salina.1